MDLQAFENLELIPKLLKKIESLEEQISKYAPALNTKSSVASYLKVSSRTINNYIKDGKLIEGVHFHRKNDKMLTFIESAVLEFAKTHKKGSAHEKATI